MACSCGIRRCSTPFPCGCPRTHCRTRGTRARIRQARVARPTFCIHMSNTAAPDVSSQTPCRSARTSRSDGRTSRDMNRISRASRCRSQTSCRSARTRPHGRLSRPCRAICRASSSTSKQRHAKSRLSRQSCLNCNQVNTDAGFAAHRVSVFPFASTFPAPRTQRKTPTAVL